MTFGTLWVHPGGATIFNHTEPAEPRQVAWTGGPAPTPADPATMRHHAAAWARTEGWTLTADGAWLPPVGMPGSVHPITRPTPRVASPGFDV